MAPTIARDVDESSSLLRDDSRARSSRTTALAAVAALAPLATIGAAVVIRRGSGAPLVGAAGAPVAHDGSRVLYRDGYIGPPMQDTCDARCGFKSYPTGEFQYLDPSCAKDPFGCGLAGQKDCRICQTKKPDYHGRPTT